MPKAAEPAVKFLQIRPTPAELDAYREAAKKDGRSMNKWAIRLLNAGAGVKAPR